MVKAVGFLAGIVLAAAIVLGALDLTALGGAQRPVAAVTNTRPASDATAAAPAPATRTESVVEPEPPNAESTGTETATPRPDRHAAATADPPRLEDAADTPPDTVRPGGERRWFLFWHPFRSQLSADGFRERLERLTGLDYRVLTLEPGRYQVAFGFTDEAERLRGLQAIEAATGLTLQRNPIQ